MILQEKDCISKKQSKRQKRMAANKEKQCPLCLEPLELDDLNFYPCKCGYQVCRFCWHRIRTNENGLCPACRRQYPEDPVTFKPLSTEEIMKQKNEKKMKEIQKKKEIAESRKQLANIRVVQKNLVYVHGLPLGVDTDEDKFRKLNNIFKEFGPVTKCVINNRTNYAGSQTPRASAYVTYQKIEDALKAYKKLPSLKIENHEIKTSLGTTKYCSNFLKNVQCPKQDCMYLHEMADEELSFTKEQIHAGQHLNCGSMLYDRMMAQATQKIAQNSQPKEAPSEKPETTTEVEKTIPEEVKLKGDSSDSSDDSSPSPVQSRLHRLYTNSEVQNSICGSDFQSRLLNSLSSENSRNIVTTSELPVQPSLSSEEIPVNIPHASVNSIHNDAKPFQNFPTNVRDMFNGNMWPEPKSIASAQPNLHNNFHQNSLPSDYIINPGNSSSSIFSRLPFANNGTSNCLEKEDDDLGFDPCQLSLDALQTIVDNEAKVNPRANVPNSKGMYVQKPTPVLSQQHMRMRSTQQHVLQQQQQQRLRNPPPPGFAANNFTSSQQPLPSPVYESRNAVPNRMSPVMNMQNSYNQLRANFPMQRFQSAGMPMSNNSIVNGYTHQAPSIRTIAPQMHDLMPRSTPNTQHMQSQRLENIPMQQYQEQNLSPSFWNVNQTQWMAAENFQNQSMPEYRPASPLLTIRPQQMRTNDYQRTLQQITTRYNNLSPFTDNSQPLSANQMLHNQLTKGVHTFP